MEHYTPGPLPEGKIGEYWAVSTHPNGISEVSNGIYSGISLSELVRDFPDEILGSHVRKGHMDKFPFLVKFIDAHDRLSAQVHPDDSYARTHENGFGKTEVWYVLDAKPGSKLLYGLVPGVNQETFKKAVLDKKIPSLLRFVDVHPGDVLYVPPGTVHTILDGILLLEVAENSESNYRIYDWDRIDKNGNKRELHLEKAYDVIEYSYKGEVNHPIPVNTEYGKYTSITECPFFHVDKITLMREFGHVFTDKRFHILINLYGEIEIVYGNDKIFVKARSAVIIPAKLTEYSVHPVKESSEIVRIYIP